MDGVETVNASTNTKGPTMCWNQRWVNLLLVTLLCASTAAEFGSAAARADEGRIAQQAEKSAIPATVEYFQDQVYCMRDKDPKLMADIALPTAGQGQYPAVLLFHGGGGVMGSRKTNLPIM